LSMMVLRYKMKNKKRAFRCPVNIGEFNVIAFLGILSSVGMFVLVVLNLLGIQTIF